MLIGNMPMPIFKIRPFLISNIIDYRPKRRGNPLWLPLRLMAKPQKICGSVLIIPESLGGNMLLEMFTSQRQLMRRVIHLCNAFSKQSLSNRFGGRMTDLVGAL
jgi:hypothetical protein